MPDRKDISDSLQKAFQPTHLIVEDESARHAGHEEAAAGGGTHFSVTIVSAKFNGLSRVARHKMVYAVLAKEFEGGLHALAVKALTPEEHLK